MYMDSGLWLSEEQGRSPIKELLIPGSASVHISVSVGNTLNRTLLQSLWLWGVK